MNRRRGGAWMFCGVLILSSFLLSVQAWADDDDPPARVARMSYTHGSVSFQPGGEGEWVDAVPNRPLTEGDNLWTDRGARAELHVGSTAIRLGGETSLTFLDLDDRALQLRLGAGAVLLRVRHLDDEDHMEVDTPNLAFRIQRNGEYRVDVNPDGHATVIDVFQGRGEAVGGGSSYTIVANQRVSFSGDEQINYDIDPLPPPDDFDEWAFERDRREDRSESASYVSREMTGYEDLDDYGHWRYVSDYGPVWVPAGMPVGWAPYRYGHWVWVAPWGWTWVDDAPWGFAPFHYGRWCLVDGVWGWVPGPVVVRPVYAPAMVAFVGGGGFHFSVSFGGGPGVAWFPLAPGEVFVPAYHVSRTYVNQVNVTNTVVNVTKVTNVYNYYTVNNNTNLTKITYVNRNAPNAVTVVSRETFVNARPVARNIVQVPEREIERAPVSHLVSVGPIRTSVMGAGKPTTVAPPPAVANRPVVAQRPPAPQPVPLSHRADPLIARPASPSPQPMPTAPAPMPGTAKPAPVTPQPNQPAIRPEWNPPRPQGPGSAQPVSPTAQPVSPTPHPESPRVEAPRTEAPRPEQPRTPEPRTEGRPQQGWSNPLARPAPPVQPKSERQSQDEEKKYQQWQQKREKPEPANPQQRAPEKHDDKPKGPSRQ